MGKQTKKRAEFCGSAATFSAEASKIVLDAFHEGYLMGIKHAEDVYGGKNED